MSIYAADDVGLAIATSALFSGEVVAFPTETVYGLGGNAYSDESVRKVFIYKKRSESKPLSVCYPNFQKAQDDIEIDERAIALANEFLPGPLTIVLKRKSSSKLSSLCSAGLETIGVRVPANSVALELLSRLSFPLTASSANKSDLPSPITAQQVADSLTTDLIILDDSACSIGIVSTIVDLTINCITRIGAISADRIKPFL